MTLPLKKFRQWKRRQRLRTAMSAGSPAESSITKRARGRRRSRLKVTNALILPAIIQVISQSSSGKKALDWLNTRVATGRGPMAIVLSAQQQRKSAKLGGTF